MSASDQPPEIRTTPMSGPTRPARIRVTLDLYEQGIVSIALMRFIRDFQGQGEDPAFARALVAARSLLDRVSD